MNVIQCPYKVTLDCSLMLFLPCEDTVRKRAMYEPESELLPDPESKITLILNFLASRTVKVKCFLLSYPLMALCYSRLN